MRSYQLLDSQQDALVDLLVSGPERSPRPPRQLPIMGDSKIPHAGEPAARDNKALDIQGRVGAQDRHARRGAVLGEAALRDECGYPDVNDELFRINAQLGIPLPAEAEDVNFAGHARLAARTAGEEPNPSQGRGRLRRRFR